MPGYPGGRKAFREFIEKNVRYPKEAEDANIEGTVIVGYDISDNGIVLNQHIIKGLGYGCDEEAIRVIGLLRYEKVRNKRLRVTMHTKTTIHFKLNKTTMTNITNITYSVTPTQRPTPTQSPEQPATSYTYTIDY